MSSLPHAQFSFLEYVQLEADSGTKHEFLRGQVYAMAGGTPEHAALAGRLARVLGDATQGGPCDVFSSDLRIRVLATGLATYPDLSIVCQPWQRDPEDKNTVLNPLLIVEVLSDSTAAYDRGEKLAQYKSISSLQEILLVAQDVRRFELWRRNDKAQWELEVANSGAVLSLKSVPAEIKVDEIYRALV